METLPQPPAKGINEHEANVMVAAVENIGKGMQAQADAQRAIAGAQADAQRHQADAQVRMAELSADADRLAMHHGFALRVLAIVIVASVIGGGFFTGRFELVTHALAGLGGLFAGYGLAKVAKS